MLLIEVARSTAELEGKAGPERGVVAAGIEIPAGTARSPDGALHALLHLSVEGILNRWLHLDGLQVTAIHFAQAIQDVGNLRLNHKNHGVMAQSGVWADEQKQVGESRDSCA